MNQTSLDKRFQKIIRQRYPQAHVLSELGGPDDVFVVDVFLIPDAELKSFDDYEVDELKPRCRNEGLPSEIFLPHSVSATRKYYAGIFRGSASGTKRKKSKHSGPQSKTQAQSKGLEAAGD